MNPGRAGAKGTPYRQAARTVTGEADARAVCTCFWSAAYPLGLFTSVLKASGLPPHATTLLSLRRPRRTPFVLGSTRHLVQGVVDLEDEQWDGRRRVLSARAVLLDDRPYELTIALPTGFRPREARCEPSAEVTVDSAERGAARLRVSRPPGAELDWLVQF